MNEIFHVSMIPYVTYCRHNTTQQNELAAAKGLLNLLRAIIPAEVILKGVEEEEKKMKDKPGQRPIVRLCQDEPYFK